MHRTQKMFSNRAKFNHFLQTLSVTLLHVVQFSGATHIPSIIILYQLFFYTPLWPFVLLYLSWTYLAEWKTPERGGRDLLRNFMRRLPIFKFMRDYYPITLVKTRDLDPQKNYIFGYHPHGVFTEGASIGLNTEACGFSEKFPGIIPHLSVTSVILKPLLYRDFDMNCNQMEISIIFRCDLVPVFGFGQNNLYLNIIGGSSCSQYSRPQLWFRNFTSYLRTCFLPTRSPINVVVGSPISVSKIDKPRKEDIDKLHTRYIDELKELYENYKDKYHPSERSELLII
ncbi:2-acylglycerol O-acyltransferase 2-like [Pocillopora damicornis]|uniref:2-acylglycerol O-acyltransferase 2-like n=1 Tax=Pocillopora damicornis TaxID=46731 RepID=UPI000F5552EC|nr:2-acylglycerol O-acyltransferase 2-like [Pocillopora damicornis]